VIVQLVQGTFPNSRQLIPAKSEVTFTVMAEDMERALMQLSMAAKDGSGIVRFEWEGEQLLLSAKSGESETSVPVSTTCSGPGKIAVSIKYLLDYFKGKTGTVTMSWSGTSAPLLFTYRDHPHVVMMPMFVKWTPGEEFKSEVAQPVNAESAAASEGGDETPAAEGKAAEDVGTGDAEEGEPETAAEPVA
jgi:hypothetical protein